MGKVRKRSNGTTMSEILKQQIKIIHAIMPTEIKADKMAKAELVSQFTEDETKRSTKDLSWSQANFLIISLGGSPIIPNRSYLLFDAKKRSHMYILSLAQQYGWTKYHNGRWIADMDAVGTWLQTKRCPVNKPLVYMSNNELSNIIIALENMVRWKNQKA